MVITGLEHLRNEYPASLHNTSVGILANHTAVTRDLITICDVVIQAGTRIAALFGPEHGAWGDAAEGVCVTDSHDSYLDIPVYSLYGNRSTPTDEILTGISVMLVDLQDIGARFYTYAHTMADLIAACGKKGIPVWVLDRPNPITGVLCEGPVLEQEYESGVGRYSIPIRHGLTLGELARLFVTRFGVDCELRVVPMRNWTRDMWFEDTSLPWIAPSPNMPTIDTATVYPGACLIEGTNLSEGRGTTRPFEFIGAPWVNPAELKHSLDELQLPGVKFRPVSFMPWASKYNCVSCRGVQIHVTDRNLFRPVLTGIAIISTLYRLPGAQFCFNQPASDGRCFFDLLAGTSQLRQAIEGGLSPWKIVEHWQAGVDAFRQSAAEITLY